MPSVSTGKKHWCIFVVIVAVSFASFAESGSESTGQPTDKTLALRAPGEPPVRTTPTPVSEAPLASQLPFTLGAYVEAFYSYNLRNPSNGINNDRGFDNRHNSFTIANVALDLQFDKSDVVGRVTLQYGNTPDSYYLVEPSALGTSTVNASNANLWKYIQQANVGYRFGLLGGLVLSAGIFLSPIGIEAVAVKDNWNFSRGNLAFALPFYHTGLRATLTVNNHWTLSLGGYNGWNSVLDNNPAKSIAAQASYALVDTLSLNLTYFAGIERPRGSPEGQNWRHLFDVNATYTPKAWLALAAHLTSGFEPTNLGLAGWAGAALYAKVTPLKPISISLRGDFIYEATPVSATSILLLSPWVASATVTFDYRPFERVSFKFEYRHDEAGTPIYFAGKVAQDPTTLADIPNSRRQDTLLVGLTAWF